MSQVDSFDYKPELAKLHGKPLGGDEKPDVFFGQVGLLRKSDWEFRQRGQSGLWVSDLFPHLAGVADELTVIRSMVAETSNHTPATFQENTGFRLNGFPGRSASWLSYGLGSETDDLPAFVVLPDARGVPAGGAINWTNGFLPARHQGVVIRSQGDADRRPVPRPADRRRAPSAPAASCSPQLNRRHLDERGGERRARGPHPQLRAGREDAARRARGRRPGPRDGGDARRCTASTARRPADFGRGCLLARRLLERGVRFVQLFSGGAFGSPRINWDGHEDVQQNHGQEARRDRPAASPACSRDLRQRGMLDDTLVLFTTEFGRTPFTQSAADVVGAGPRPQPVRLLASGWPAPA